MRKVLVGKINLILIDLTRESNTGIFDLVAIECVLYYRRIATLTMVKLA